METYLFAGLFFLLSALFVWMLESVERRFRKERQEAWFRFIREELMPDIHNTTMDIMEESMDMMPVKMKEIEHKMEEGE